MDRDDLDKRIARKSARGKDNRKDKIATGDDLSGKWRLLTRKTAAVILDINPKYEVINLDRMSGSASVRSLIGVSTLGFFSKSHHKTAKTAINDCIRTQRVGQFIAPACGDESDETAWYRVILIPHAIKGRVLSILLVCFDTTSEIKTETALRETTEYSRAVLNATMETIALLDKDGRVLIINETGARRFKKTSEELVGQVLLDPENRLLPDDILKARANYIKHVLKTGRAVKFEDERNGIIFRNHIYPVFDKSGKVYRVVIYADDITERKKAELALKENEERFRELADLLPQTIFELDARGKFIYVNKHAYQSSGYTEEDVKKGIRAVDTFAPQDKSKAKTRLKKMLSGEKLSGTEYLARRKDGSVYPVAVYSSPITRNGKIAGIRGISIDISGRKQVEHDLTLAQEKYRLIVDNVGSSIAIFDEAGIIHYANKIAAQSFGLEPATMIGKTMWDLFPKEVANHQMNTIRSVIHTGKESMSVTKSRLLDESRWFHTVIQAIRPSGDSPVQAMVIATDVTEDRENDIRNTGRLELLDRIREADNARDMILFGCQAIKEFGLYDKSAFFMMDKMGKVSSIGKFGFRANEFKKIQAIFADSLSDTIKPQFSKKLHGCYLVLSRKGDGTFVPRPIGDGRSGKGRQWSSSDLGLFYLESGDDSNQEFWVVVGEPCDDRNPSQRDAEYLQEIAEIITKDLLRIDGIERLKKEEQALRDANVALGKVLEHIEKEKNEIRQQLADNIEQNIMPVLGKLVRGDGTVHGDFYNVLKTGLKGLIFNSSGVNQLLAHLTPRELEICNFIKTGLSNTEIASNLFISVGTVKKHREQIRRKLGLSNKKINLAVFLRGNQGV